MDTVSRVTSKWDYFLTRNAKNQEVSWEGKFEVFFLTAIDHLSRMEPNSLQFFFGLQEKKSQKPSKVARAELNKKGPKSAEPQVQDPTVSGSDQVAKKRPAEDVKKSEKDDAKKARDEKTQKIPSHTFLVLWLIY